MINILKSRNYSYRGNANQTTVNYHLTPIRMTIMEKCGWGGGEIETLIIQLVRVQSGAIALENSLAGPQKVKHVVTVWPSNATLRVYRADTAERNGHLCPREMSRMHVRSSVIHNRWKVEAGVYQLMNGYAKCMNKIFHTVEYFWQQKGLKY